MDPSLLFIIFIGMGLLMPYFMARQRTKAYKQSQRRYDSLIESLDELKGHVDIEADRWPIYARPVMFTEFDHNAQIEFAQAQKALTDADTILPAIESIPEPEVPEKFDPRYLFHYPKNFRSIKRGNKFVGSVSFLESSIENLSGSVKTIRREWYKAENTRREIRKAIKELKNRIDFTSTNLITIDSWGSSAVNQVSWALTIANNCHLKAYEQVLQQSEDEQGYLEHAIADEFIVIGHFALDFIDLCISSQSVSRRYDLDVFAGFFRRTSEHLQSVLLMDDWNGWRKLKRAKPYIDQFPEIKKQAEKSLYEFKKQKDLFENLIAQINEIDLDDEIERTEALLKECTHYWYSYDERRSDWQAVIGNLPIPSIELNNIQSDLVTDIFPAIGVDIVISQSSITQLSKKIEQLLKKYRIVNRTIRRLATSLAYHKDAQVIVNALIAENGAAHKALIRLRAIIDDTSPDISEGGAMCVNTYQRYFERAIKVRGANFPDLKVKFKELIQTIEGLLEQHSIQLTRLSMLYENLYDQISTLSSEIDRYLHYTPSFDNQTIKFFGKLFDGGWKLLQLSVVHEYSWLSDKTSDMQKWIQQSDPYIVRAREKYHAFAIARSQMEKQLLGTKSQLELHRKLVNRKWGWVKSEMIPVIEQIESELDIQAHEWKRHEERKWAELTIHEAILHCEHLVKFTKQLLNELNMQIAEVSRKQISLNNLFKDITRISATNTRKLSQDEQQEIRTLLNLAMRAEHYDTAETLLSFANSLALKQANWRERKTIKHIININSRGGTVVLGNVRTGRDFVGRDVKKYTSKK